MGDAADMVLEGICCQSCGGYIEDGDAPGHPRDCTECADGPRSPRRIRQKRHRGSTPPGRMAPPVNGIGEKEMARLKGLCYPHKIVLKRCNDVHYQIDDRCRRNALLNVYPGKCTYYWDHNFPGPHFEMSQSIWTLGELVEEYIKQIISAKPDTDNR